MNILVLGCGLVGRAIAHDLSQEANFNVTVTDIDEISLKKLNSNKIKTVQANLLDESKLNELLAGAEMAINAVPGAIGFKTLQTIIKSGTNVVDIAFYAEDFLQLNDLALQNKVTAICDMGVAPGMSNLLAAYLAWKLDKADNVKIMVGGLPKIRKAPFEYSATFSPSDLVEEYTRPARIVVNGKMVAKPALSDVENIQIEGLGTLEAFNSDGLRSLIQTLDVPDMAEKTLRYPGHVSKVMNLIEGGFFDEKPMIIGGTEIKPVDVTARLLFKKLDVENGEEDITVMKIIAEGTKDGNPTRVWCELTDHYDTENMIHSMARTTGYTATVTARLLAKGIITQKGIIAPEYLAKDEKIVRSLLDGLEMKGVVYDFFEEIIQ